MSMTSPADIVAVWRPLSQAEHERAQALIDSAEREINRRWPVAELIAAGKLALEDVQDVVVWLVIPVLGGPPAPGAKAWQVTSGSESRSITLDAAGNPRDPWVFADWMLRIFEGQPDSAHPQGTPRGAFPKAGRFDRIFGSAWPEEYP